MRDNLDDVRTNCTHLPRSTMRGTFKTSKIGPKKKPVISDWEIGDYFGSLVVRGFVNGDRVCKRLLWWANERFGVTSEGNATETVFKVGPRS